HNPKVAGSNPAPATSVKMPSFGAAFSFAVDQPSTSGDRRDSVIGTDVDIDASSHHNTAHNHPPVTEHGYDGRNKGMGALR
ncbi:MAG: hypothetical protein ACO3LC_05250, partial [Ilumatobacteraceae bacterium]